MKCLMFGLFTVFLCGCQPIRPEPYYITLAHQVRDEFITDVKHKHPLEVYATGGGLTTDIDEITVGFISKQHYTIDEAREEFVLLAEDFLRRLNTWELIRPYLHNYPATIANFDLKLMFLDQNRQDNFISDGEVAGIFVSNKGNLVYYTSGRETGKLQEIYEEPYEEALRIVRQKHLSL